ncbi:hypothetical protein [Methylobacterium sp.]|uniref:hypothetical protein n=1 Tax=Methylobacterium sp. TaxID=409 RepID=UPI000C4D26EE|nr:hypothetical protein [Methylobacterium sp.]MBP28140.1 hypothetical protein [Methylobacterium sp.]
MPFGLSLKNLIRRGPETPSLRERAADLRTSLSRRSVVAGTVAAAVPLPALAMSPPSREAEPHPDQDLFDIEALCVRADAAEKAARAASGAARAAFRAALGPFPPELLMTAWEAQTFSQLHAVRSRLRLPTHLVYHADHINPEFGWTAEGLQRAIGSAVTLFGRGGQTPHRVRRWRGLLPAAAVYDARHDELERKFRTEVLRDEFEDARKTAARARGLLTRTPAKTVEGLAVHTRALASVPWYEGGNPYRVLLQSAAAITGVTLRQPDFDVPAWLDAWEKIGGRVEYCAEREEWAFVHPSTDGASLETRDRIRGLYNEKCSNSSAIDLWLEPRATDPRFARA